MLRQYAAFTAAGWELKLNGSSVMPDAICRQAIGCTTEAAPCACDNLPQYKVERDDFSWK